MITRYRDADLAYQDLIRYVDRHGEITHDRTGVGTKEVFATAVGFDLEPDEVPVISLKRVFWKTAIKEMLLFLRGETRLEEFLRWDVHIWSEWPYRKFLDDLDKTRGDGVRTEITPIGLKLFEDQILSDPEFSKTWGDLGPIYGGTWRKWQGNDGKIYDQVADLVHALKHNPTSRRKLFSGWDYPKLGEMALPPCHLLYQYHVRQDGRLESLLFQRSADCFLGVPFNWTGQRALQMMLAKTCDLTPGDMFWIGGSTHLYTNHLEHIPTIESRWTRNNPRLILKTKRNRLEDYVIEDFEMVGYDPHPAISAQVAV